MHFNGGFTGPLLFWFPTHPGSPSGVDGNQYSTYNLGNLPIFWFRPRIPPTGGGPSGQYQPRTWFNQGNLPFFAFHSTAKPIGAIRRAPALWFNGGNQPFFPWRGPSAIDVSIFRAVQCIGTFETTYTVSTPSYAFECVGAFISSYTSHPGPLVILCVGMFASVYQPHVGPDAGAGACECVGSLVSRYSPIASGNAAVKCVGVFTTSFSVQIGQLNECVVASPVTTNPKNAVY